MRCHFELPAEAAGTVDLDPAAILRYFYPEYGHRKKINHQHKLTIHLGHSLMTIIVRQIPRHSHPDYIGKFQNLLFANLQRDRTSKLKDF